MCIYIYVCICICIYKQLYVFDIYIYIYMYIYIYIYIYMYLYLYLSLSLSLYIYIYIYKSYIQVLLCLAAGCTLPEQTFLGAGPPRHRCRPAAVVAPGDLGYVDIGPIASAVRCDRRYYYYILLLLLLIIIINMLPLDSYYTAIILPIRDYYTITILPSCYYYIRHPEPAQLQALARALAASAAALLRGI